MTSRKQYRTRRGVAFILVLVVISLASILGYAMLSSTQLRSQISHNADLTAQAEVLAESGVNLAVYYLNYPENAPGGPFAATGTYWTGTGSAISFVSGMTGTMNVSVQRLATDKWTYDIVSTGRAVGDSTTTISRTIRSRVTVKSEYQVNYAGVVSNDITVPTASKFVGSLYSQKGMTLKALGNVTGVGYRKNASFSLFSPMQGWAPLPAKPVVTPAFSEIRSYRTYNYASDGSTDTAGSITASTISADLGPTATNRAGIYYVEGNTRISSSVNINGTLIVNGDLVFDALNIKITPKPGYPAIIVQGNVELRPIALAKVQLDGLVWVGGKMFAAAACASAIDINGAVIINGVNPFFNSSLLVVANVKHTPENVKVVDLSEVGRTITGVSVQSWSAAQ